MDLPDQRDDAADEPHVLVVFASRHGSTAGIAERVAGRLREGGNRVDLHSVGEVDSVVAYDAVVLGSPVYDQAWPPEADSFAAHHRGALAERPVWLFSVGSFGDRKRLIGPLMRREPRNIAELRAAIGPRDYRVFAGVVEKQRWPLLSRVFFRLLGGRFGDQRDWPAIDEWAAAIAAALRGAG